ncbi:sarcosine oxidase subunit alpha [Spinactinospora alkalitolerans]|uniref:Sarcosine oxidase subunit alpha n=1 Tax=Spinactinospora alkalitolerans TaxID=687207 RepID=A0A852TPF8_9ACTN|nr:2Fe-2S iron-sulfur cluster-binding protein [Spinactinospora alkalitolerans]NYE45351.1 sarcosine oxidase subunit alpha [Spinactinospora alkalitolerans]
MSEALRLPSGGRIDRGTTLNFHFNGAAYTGRPGDTLASALLANGVHHVADSVRLGRPRGIFAAGAEEPTALVRVEAPTAETMVTATTVELSEGLRARGLNGHGRLEPGAALSDHDAMHAHCDVLVVGAGPAGLAAALTAARTGARVVLADEHPEPGGSLLGTGEPLAADDGSDWVARCRTELESCAEVRLLTRTTVFGHFDDNHLMALQHRAPGPADGGGGARRRVWRIRARRVVLATGAHERSYVFSGNDRPGIMLAAAARRHLHRHAVLAGTRAVVCTTNDSAYAAALDLAAAGVDVAAVADARPAVPAHWRDRCAAAGIEVLPGHAVVSTSGHERITGAHVAALPTGPGGRLGPRRGIHCDLLCVSGGWNPVLQLFAQARGELRYDETLAAFVPGRAPEAVLVAGAANGRFGTADCLAEGARAGEEAARAAGFRPGAPVRLPEAREPAATAPRALWSVPDPGDDPGRHFQFVDLQRDATVADIVRAVRAGMRSVEHVKRYTTIGTAHDQGKTSGVLAIGVVSDVLGRPVGELGAVSFRPPYIPVGFAALAGRDRGHLHAPVRVTAMHDRHVAAGARFEDVGEWKRPWFYPRRGEDMDAAVQRECRAARRGVAMMDVSTLGKIEVQGPDAAAFLDLVYTNLISTLNVGRIRYGLMCTADGMVLDDGTVMRLAEHRFLLTTTTGNAAAVLDWLEEWSQTEWPHLRVRMASVTDHWATVALVGPRARGVLRALAPGLDAANDAFPFMSWREADVAGIGARVCRISFSGELAYEINVPWWSGRRLWDALGAAGAGHGITAYGTETMHVLRAEKGYPVVGQDTDGTVTPHDLGMHWAVSKKKSDFIGRRSFDRADTCRDDRAHFVGLLPADPQELLPEGTQLVADAPPAESPEPALGHVTSSYRSAALGRTFALAMVRAGRDRMGGSVRAVVGDRTVPVTITGTVFYDQEGARRDG